MEQPERARFDRALSKLLMTTNGQQRVPSHIAKTYWSVLKQFSWENVSAGMTAAVSQAQGHISPATLANFCRPNPGDVMQAAGVSRAHELERRMSAADAEADRAGEKRFGDLWYESEFRDVLRVANMEFARRCAGEMPGGVRIPTPDVYGYVGPFDYSAIVQGMTRPKGKTANDASAAWECFWCVLAEEFTNYQDAL